MLPSPNIKFKLKLEANNISGKSFHILSEVFGRCYRKMTSIGFRETHFLFILIEEFRLLFNAQVVRISHIKYDSKNELESKFKTPKINIIAHEYDFIKQHFKTEELISSCQQRKETIFRKKENFHFQQNNNLNNINTLYVVPIKQRDNEKILGILEVYTKKLSNENLNFSVPTNRVCFELLLEELFFIGLNTKFTSIPLDVSKLGKKSIYDSKENFIKFNKNISDDAAFIKAYQEYFKPLDIFLLNLTERLSSHLSDEFKDNFNFNFLYRLPTDETISFILTSKQIEDLIKKKLSKDDIFSYCSFKYENEKALVGYILETKHSEYIPKSSDDPRQKRWLKSKDLETIKQIKLIKEIYKDVGENIFLFPVFFDDSGNILFILSFVSSSDISVNLRKKIFDLAYDSASMIESTLISQNITEEMIKKEYEALARLGNYAGILSHELNTPLNRLDWELSDLIEGKIALDEIPERINPLFFEINKARDSLKKFYSVASGKEEKNSEHSFDIVQDIKQTINSCLQNRNWKLNISFNENKSIKIRADREGINHVIRNLLRNAHDAILQKYKNDYKVQVKDVGKISINIERSKNHICISVKDNGIGIAEENMPKIFNPLYSSKDTRAAFGGLGLGLSSSKAIIDRHNGQLTFESKPGEGSAFNIILPL